MAKSKFSFLLIACQIIFVIIFGLLAEYEEPAQAKSRSGKTPVTAMYPMFQDVHVMIFIGFGFLMTFLKRYGYSAIGINLLLASFVIQWALIVRGFIHGNVLHGGKFSIGLSDMLTADFAAATVLISFGAVLGKTSALQLLIMAVIEVVLSQLNEHIGLQLLNVVDLGESIFIHAFGAYFGLAVARVLYSNNLDEHQNEGTVYHSDLFSMIGTIFLWLYWPSFNGGAASGGEQYRAVINTYLSLVACTIITFAVSSIVDKNGKLEMVHIQNATLAGGVAVGSTAGMPLHPWGALVIGCLAGLLSTIGFRLITPCLSSKIKLHDTCGVHNLHGMPGVLAGIASAVLAALSSYEKWSDRVTHYSSILRPTIRLVRDITPLLTVEISSMLCIWLGRSGVEQGGFQMVALIITLAIALIGGTITDLYCGWPGSVHDSRVLKNTSASDNKERMFPGNTHLIGDAAYALSQWVMTPFKDFGNLSAEQKRYNYIHSSSRMCIERAFGALKGRFRRLRYIDMKDMPEVVKFVLSCCTLHEVCLANFDDFDEYIEEGLNANEEINDFQDFLRRRPSAQHKRQSIVDMLG
ncbi:ammonium transporter Rh [Mytilus galloprovincialis]|uniref:Ammonium transporter Rh n=1 Tax=Mytilus galloprovincialis TaxID=29158 RepID=A0A8B6BTG9_MYTGA|nr:ammonium transporter Rh [Mytilus galloprovincialis]